MGDRYEYGRGVRRDEEFDEEDVWAVMRERREGSPTGRNGNDSSSSTPRRLSSASRMIPKSYGYAENGVGGGGGGGVVFQQSAPVNIPDWSKIYKKKGSFDVHDFNGWHHVVGGYGGYVDSGNVAAEHFQGGEEDEDDDEDDEHRIPPHEWIARKLARSQISSSSVCEGAGRTLKGRDLSKVRNAVLTRTGFLE